MIAQTQNHDDGEVVSSVDCRDARRATAQKKLQHGGRYRSLGGSIRRQLVSSAKVVAYVSPAPGFLLSHRVAVIREAQRRGFRTVAIVPESGENAALSALGVETVVVPFTRSTMDPREVARTAFAIRDYLHRARPAVLHAIAMQGALVAALGTHAAPRARFVVSLTGLGTLWTDRPGLRAAAIRASVASAIASARSLGGPRLIFQNGDAAADFRRASPLVVRCQDMLVPGSGVDLRRFGVSPMGERDTVLFLGRALREKGVHEFLALARELAPRTRLRFVVAGAPDEGNPSSIAPAVLDEARACGWITEWGRRDDIPALLRRTKLLFFPSRREGFPKAVMEAAAAGVPAVGFDVPGVRSAIAHGDTGLLLKNRDLRSVAEAIEILLSNERQLAAFSEAARARAEREFDEKALAARVVDAYGEAGR